MTLVDSLETVPTGASLVRISTPDQLEAARKLLGIRPDCPTIVLVGGAGGMDAENIAAIREFFENHLVPFIDNHQLAVLDGGTNAGIMEAIGTARRHLSARFPLIGVLVETLARLTPGILQKDHTHFVFTPGSDWGDETPWLGNLAGAIAGRSRSLTVLVNGGEIAWRDAAASIAAGRPVLVAEGSGRTADKISRTQSGRSQNLRAAKLIKSRLVIVENPFTQPDRFMSRLRDIFGVV